MKIFEQIAPGSPGIFSAAIDMAADFSSQFNASRQFVTETFRQLDDKAMVRAVLPPQAVTTIGRLAFRVTEQTEHHGERPRLEHHSGDGGNDGREIVFDGTSGRCLRGIQQLWRGPALDEPDALANRRAGKS